MKPDDNQNPIVAIVSNNDVPATSNQPPSSLGAPAGAGDYPSTATPPNKSYKKVAIISVVILVLISIGFGFFALYYSKHRAKSSASTASAVTSKLTGASTVVSRPTSSYGGIAIFNSKGVISLANSSGSTIKTISFASTFGSNPTQYLFNVLPTSNALLLHSNSSKDWNALDPDGTYQTLGSSVDSRLSSYNVASNPGALVDGKNIFITKGAAHSSTPYTYDSVNLNTGQVAAIVTVKPLQKNSVFQPYSITPNGTDIVALLYEVSIGSSKVTSTPTIAEINIKTHDIDKLSVFPREVATNSSLCGATGCDTSSVGLSADGNLIVYCDNVIANINGASTQTCGLHIYNLTTQRDIQLSVPVGFIPASDTIGYRWIFSPNDQYIAVSGNGPPKAQITQGEDSDSDMYIFSTSTGTVIKQYDAGNSGYNQIQGEGWLSDSTLGYEVATTASLGEFLNQPIFYSTNVSSSLQATAYPSSLGMFLTILPTNSH